MLGLATTPRLFGKFLLILVPFFVFASVIALNLASEQLLGQQRDSHGARIGNLSARVAASLGKGETLDDRRLSQSYLNLLLADPAIKCAQLVDSTGRMIASAPPKIGCTTFESLPSVVLSVSKSREAELVVRFSSEELEAAAQRASQFSFLSIFIGLIVAVVASWFGFRTIVGRPVKALLDAIRTSAAGANLKKVGDIPGDELGTVIAAFNTMQDELGTRAERNEKSLRRLDHVYNDTPALMFNLCPDGRIVNVSGYWLEKTGYTREEVVGQPLATFLADKDNGDLKQLLLSKNETPDTARNMSIRLNCRDGEILDTLMSAVPDATDGATESCYLCVMTDVSQLRQAQAKLRRQAVTDQLTGLPNRQGLFEVLAELSADRHADASVIFVDLDNFKWVNDTLGHEAGDIVLQEAARRFAQCVREGDTIARLGGDEFAIVTRSGNSSSVARDIADRALRAMSAPFTYGGNTFFVGCSVGFASLGKHARSTEELLRLADLAMYNSKQEGRNRISEYSTDLGERTQSLAATHARIRTALKDNQFRLFYQPIVRLSTMEVAGAEALLRLQCPNEDAIPAAEVIRVAEQSGLIGQIGEWVLREGFDRIASGMPQAIAQGSYLSINLSPKQLDRRFMPDLVSRLARSPDIARHLVLEITETALLDQDESVASFIRDIRATGARVALDDFGIGYSSLNYVSRFPVDIVKLDRSFISGLSASIAEGGNRNLALIKATVTLAGELHMAIVAEGIEDEGTLRTLQALGIDLGQGYLFSPPLPEKAFVEWLAAFSGRSAGLGQQHRMSA